MMAEYHYTIHHLPGKQNMKADALSRCAESPGEHENENVVILPEELFCASLLSDLNSDPLPTLVLTAQMRHRTKNLLSKDKRYTQDDKGFIRYNGKVYIPSQDQDLIEEVLWNSHNAPIAGHPGRLRTQELVLCDFWFPQMSQTIQKYIEGCETCQRTKILRQSPAAPLYPNQIPRSL